LGWALPVNTSWDSEPSMFSMPIKVSELLIHFEN